MFTQKKMRLAQRFAQGSIPEPAISNGSITLWVCLAFLYCLVTEARPWYAAWRISGPGTGWF